MSRLVLACRKTAAAAASATLVASAGVTPTPARADDTPTHQTSHTIDDTNAKLRHLEQLLAHHQSLDAEAARIQRAVALQEEDDAMKLLDALRAHDDAMADQLEEAKATVEQTMLVRMRSELEAAAAEHEAQLRELHEAYVAQLHEAVEFATAVAEERLDAVVATERGKAEVELQSLLHDERQRHSIGLANLEIDIDALAMVLSSDTQYKQTSHAVQQLSAAAFELGEGLEGRTSHQRFRAAFEAIETVSARLEHPLLSQLCEAVKPVASDVPSTMPQLQARFVTTAASSRVAALVPEGSGIWGRLLASITSALTFEVPQQILPTLPDAEARSPTQIISRASGMLEGGDLHGAVREIRDLRGPPGATCAGWLEEAERRLLLEQALRVANAEASVSVAALC